MKKLILIVIIAFSISGIYAQSDLKKQNVSVFKNGTAFFVKSGKINAENNRYILNDTPEALFGTLWFNCENERVVSVRNLENKKTEKKDAKCIRDMLSANIGKSVKIYPQSGETFDATVESVEDEMILLRSKDNWISTYATEIKMVEFNEKPTTQYDFETEKNQIAVEFGSGGSKNIDMMYLQKEIGWFPNYLIELEDDKNAVITLKSTLINDAEDLENADVNFVVGVPNFRYNYLSSPLSSTLKLTDFINSLNGIGISPLFRNELDNNRVALSNAIMTQQAISADYRQTESNINSEFSMAEGGSQEDLYFYTHKNVNLKKGERASYELLYARLPYEHVYEVNIPTNTNGYGYFSSRYNYDESNINKVWHSIKLSNNTKMPWTTGTAMVVKNEGDQQKPISQDMLKYTPVKSDTYLKITVSPDISVKDKDTETKRAEKAKKRGSSFYDMVTVEGKILVKNFKEKDISLNIKRTVSGELKSSDTEWKFTKVMNYYNDLNPTNEVEWEVKVKAGEEKEISYTYTMYIYN